MSKYIIRLDDAAPKRNIKNWNRVEKLFDFYGIRPLVGVIPDCKDPEMEQYENDSEFWQRVKSWENKGWILALHGYTHLYCTEDGGINPVNRRSEFAGLSLELQKEKICEGLGIFENQGITPKVFFAPAHTFDLNTIRALKEESGIRIISDTIANRPYQKYGITFVPQQSGRVRKLPLHTVTFCYHPNTMTDDSFTQLEIFIKRYGGKFIDFPCVETERNASFFDWILKKIYFFKR